MQSKPPKKTSLIDRLVSAEKTKLATVQSKPYETP
jgi:hypothetical protein